MSEYTILWSKSAKLDLEDIINYIKIDSKMSALKILNSIQKHVKKLNDFPEQGRIIPELDRFNIKSYRELIVSPWRIFYKRNGSIISIVAVIDGRRNIEDILLRRNIR